MRASSPRITGSAPGPERRWQSTQRAPPRSPGVTGVAPYVEMQALAVRLREMLPVCLRGIDPRRGAHRHGRRGVDRPGQAGSISYPGTDRVIVGEVHRRAARARRRRSVDAADPDGRPTARPRPGCGSSRVAGVFEVGRAGSRRHARLRATSTMSRGARRRSGGPRGPARAVSTMRWRAPDARRVEAACPGCRSFEVIDWTQDNASYFRAIRIEKTMMALILMLIVGGRGVQHRVDAGHGGHRQAHRHRDPAHLRRIARGAVMGVFITQGLVIGWLGVALGVGARARARVATSTPSCRFLEQHLRLPDLRLRTSTTSPRFPPTCSWTNVACDQRRGAARSPRLATIYPAHARRRAPRRPKRCATSRRMARAVRMADRHAVSALDAPARLRVVRRVRCRCSGLMLGVATLIVVLSVMNGFERELRNAHPQRDVACDADRASTARLPTGATCSSALEASPACGRPCRTSRRRRMLANGEQHGRRDGARRDPAEEEREATGLAQRLTAGRARRLAAGPLSTSSSASRSRPSSTRRWADQRRADRARRHGDPDRRRAAHAPLSGRRASFESGMYEFDRGLALVHIADAARLYRLGDRVTGMRLALQDPLQAPARGAAAGARPRAAGSTSATGRATTPTSSAPSRSPSR